MPSGIIKVVPTRSDIANNKEWQERRYPGRGQEGTINNTETRAGSCARGRMKNEGGKGRGRKLTGEEVRRGAKK